ILKISRNRREHPIIQIQICLEPRLFFAIFKLMYIIYYPNQKGKFIMKKILIIGAGPAGLACAYEFIKQKKTKEYQIEIYESDDQVGGLAKTLNFKGYRFDLGGHRFYTKIREVEKLYGTILGRNLLERERLSRIYYKKEFYSYPLAASEVIRKLGVVTTLKVLMSWFSRQFHKYKDEKTFDKWVANRFGDELFRIFFKSYTEKLWGIPTSKLSSDWAAQRIQNFNLLKAAVDALFSINLGSKTIIKKFDYPQHGPGMLYEEMQKILIKNGIKIYLNHEVISLHKTKGLITGATILNKKSNKQIKKETDYIVSTMPLNRLISAISPVRTDLADITKGLNFRNFITVNLLVKKNPFDDQWIYIHDPEVKVGRIQNFRNWSPFMVKKGADNTPIGMEYFCSENDKFWKMPDKQLIKLGKEEIARIGLVSEDEIVEGFVYKVKNAYPVYDFGYQEALSEVKKYIKTIGNLELCGRGGLFRYNNQDSSILTGFYAARKIIDPFFKYDTWSVNEEKDYLERK
ncbi:MAG: NAD(P)/FAD-dependent oxidoreductase, partial [Candidatus Daviesbacteria bacterium]|nr:NAD(P)/FAD-dependent oxidoreductase [Candidatus Daviesbacteria bacterium]